MEIDGYSVVMRFDPDIDMYRGELVGLNGGADFLCAGHRRAEARGCGGACSKADRAGAPTRPRRADRGDRLGDGNRPDAYGSFEAFSSMLRCPPSMSGIE